MRNANAICAQLLLLAAEIRTATSTCTSLAGGSVTRPACASTTRCSASSPDVVTVGMGLTASMGQFTC